MCACLPALSKYITRRRASTLSSENRPTKQEQIPLGRIHDGSESYHSVDGSLQTPLETHGRPGSLESPQLDARRDS